MKKKEDFKQIINFLNTVESSEESKDTTMFNPKPYSKNGYWGFQDEDGDILFDCVFKQVNGFADGRCLVQFNGFAKNEWAIIDDEGNILTKQQ